jgi:S-adenosylmethionine:tRNA ribosyltransferase-isomerase
MVHDIKIEDYAYILPSKYIARYPLPERDASKLLVYDGKTITQSPFSDIAARMPEKSLLVYNNTRVIRARFHFKKYTGGLIEIFCLEPQVPNTFESALLSRRKCEWTCLVGNRKKYEGELLKKKMKIRDDEFLLTARIENYTLPSNRVCFEWDHPDCTFADILEAAGILPIPPYLGRATEDRDLESYQTVYASVKGSVAAPTAGLHFTPQLLRQLDHKGFKREEITLHVGAGTFMPITSDRISEHKMHREFFSVHRSTLINLLDNVGRITAVGTTSVRTLESLYHIGRILADLPSLDPEILSLEQWAAYNTVFPKLSAEKSLEHLIKYMDRMKINDFAASTQLFIVPGYEFRVVNNMITNFHQPKSTLLLLVSAFTGGNWKKIYKYAFEHDFRFLSYGDASLLIRR